MGISVNGTLGYSAIRSTAIPGFARVPTDLRGVSAVLYPPQLQAADPKFTPQPFKGTK